MPDRVPIWARPAKGPVTEPFTWLSFVLRAVGLPAMAVLWWALAFLAWDDAGLASMSKIWPPTLPVLFTDLDVAVFGSLGASLVVVALLGQRTLSVGAVLLGFLVSLVLTLTRGTDVQGAFRATSERQSMLIVCAVATLAGLVIGDVAIGSLRRFGFVGLLAVPPVVSLVAVLFFGPGADHRWVTRSALVVLLVMIAWLRWSDVLFWPAFFALLWFLTLTMSALESAAGTLGRTGGGNLSLLSVNRAMLDFAGSSWRTVLGTSWDLFWPAAVIAAVVVAALYVWRRVSATPA